MPAVIADVHYLHFGIMLFVIVAVLCVVISLLTEPIDPKHVSSYLEHSTQCIAQPIRFCCYRQQDRIGTVWR